MGASERDEWLRAAWNAMVANELDARRLVFVDKMGANTSLAPIYAWAPKGRRAYSKVPRNRGPNTTLLASITTEGMGPCVAVVGSITRAAFEAYVEQVLSAALKPGQVVVLSLPAGPHSLKTGSYTRRGRSEQDTSLEVVVDADRTSSPRTEQNYRSEAVVGSRTSTSVNSEYVSFPRMASEACKRVSEYIN